MKDLESHLPIRTIVSTSVLPRIDRKLLLFDTNLDTKEQKKPSKSIEGKLIEVAYGLNYLTNLNSIL